MMVTSKSIGCVLTFSTVPLSVVVVVVIVRCLPYQSDMSDTVTEVPWWYCAVAILLGLWSKLLTGFVPEILYFCSYIPFAKSLKLRSVCGYRYQLRPCCGTLVNHHLRRASWHHDLLCSGSGNRLSSCGRWSSR